MVSDQPTTQASSDESREVTWLLYAVDYAPKGAAHIVSRNGTGDIERLELPAYGLSDDSRRKAQQARLEFLQRLSTEDAVLLEMGAAGDKFGLAAHRKGVAVLRVPTFRIKPFRTERGIEDVADSLLQFYLDHPGEFYPFTPRDETIVRLRVFTRARWVYQKKLRIPAELRLQQVYRDLYLLDSEGDEESFVRARLTADPVFRALSEKEKEMEDRINEALRPIPLYKALFVPIKGMGPLTAGTIIAEIGDIRRFRTPGALKAYAGYHVLPGGIVPKRQHGKVFAVNTNLRQGVWLFTSLLDRMPEDAEWKQLLLKRLEYERARFPALSKGWTRGKARRHVGQKLLEWVWFKWREFEGIAT